VVGMIVASLGVSVTTGATSLAGGVSSCLCFPFRPFAMFLYARFNFAVVVVYYRRPALRVVIKGGVKDGQ
jgi:hypothetical protein